MKIPAGNYFPLFRQTRRPLAPLLLLCCGLAATGADIAPPLLLPSLPTIQQQAVELDVAHDQQWLTLLHYDRGVFGLRGLIDDEKFWLDPRGKKDPAIELAATLAGLWNGDPTDPEKSVAARFPARAAFLAERLGFSLADLPVSGSAELEKTLAELGARKSWIIFPMGYLSSPASMFGHTFLLIQGQNESPLLSQAISYGAKVTPGGGPLAVIMGLTGGYSGYFTVLPYHRKVQEYTDLDQRDIWEYELALSPQELERLLRHTWELRNIGSDYWFFDENCSFNLLYLLDVARPGINLHARSGAWVMPGETVRWIQQADLVSSVQYRPSRATKVTAAQAALPTTLSDEAVAIAHGKQDPAQIKNVFTDPIEQAHALDLAGEILHALAGRQALTIKDYRTRLHNTLANRAALGKQPPLPEPPTPIAPDQGHQPFRVSLGYGYENNTNYLSFSARAAQHDLLDKEDGNVPGGALTFGEIDLRWYSGEGVRIHRLDAVSVTSIAPYESVFRRWSWTASGGLIDETMSRDGNLHQHVRLGGGAGLGLALPGGYAWGLGLVEGRAFGIAEGYALGSGAQIGAAVGSGPVRLLGTMTAHYYFLGWEETNWELLFGLRFAPAANWAIDVGATRYNRWDHLATGLHLRGMLYF